tara:strand:+ start:594 stop:839 length:246 start_codon:yes stop_codon:yes gene_type:complete
MKIIYDGGLELTLDAVEIEFEYYSHDAGTYYTPAEGGYVEITSIKYNGVEVMSWLPVEELEHLQEMTYEREKDSRDEYPED